MARKPSDRKHDDEVSTELNLIPIMNLVLMLIPVILLTAAFVELSVINVSAPQIGGGEPQQPKDKPDEPPLNLTLVLTDQGFTIAGSGGVLGQEQADPNAQKGPTVPKRPDGKYDWNGLTKKSVEIKDAFPEETKVIINAEPDITYEFLVRTMDASRETPDHRDLFPDVILSAGIS